jgi:hypothetical protein
MESRNFLTLGGIRRFAVASFQAGIGFSPPLSLCFGAPEALVKNIYVLIPVCFPLAGIIAVFGIQALCGAGHIR